MLRSLLLVLSLIGTVAAQTVRVANHSTAPFAGWVRTTVDTSPALPAGQLADGTRYVLGRRVGLDVWALDLNVSLPAAGERTIPLAGATAWSPPALTLPADPLGYFGGWATFGGVPLGIVSLTQDAAAWNVHLRGRVGTTLAVDAWLDWRPSLPALVTGEVTVTASNPSVPDVLETVPAAGYGLRWGASTVWNSQVCPGGTTFADGQARTLPVVLVWSEHVANAVEWLQVAAAVNRSVSAVGIERLWPGGNPRLQPGLDATAWTRARWPAALAVANTWEAAVMGPNKNSADTGAQQDQVWVSGECMAGLGPEQVAYLSALKLAARPCHHLRFDGEQLDPSEKPNVQFWFGRPHQSTGDLLGKSRDVGPDDTNGWGGPDTEHWLYNGCVAATRLTGSRALQAELSQQARLFLFSQVLPSAHPEWFTAGVDASRAVGWVLLVACHLDQNLEDRALAARVRQRAIDRIQQVYVPKLDLQNVWDVRVDDPRLGPGAWWMPWQQAIGAYGLDLASERFGVPQGRVVALRAAKAVLAGSWVKVGSRWQSRAQMPVAGGGPSDESFNLFGMPLAVAVVLRQEPQNAQARAIWTQLLADATQAGQLAWLPPEIALAPAAPTRSTITQWGITWTLSAPAPAGQFCNGDWWVVGPVSITAIDPPCVVTGGRTINGSMVNPPMTGACGYDSAIYSTAQGTYAGDARVYVPALNVARTMPLVVDAGSSLVSTISQVAPTASSPSQIKTAAILTVLATAPPADAFRPPYCGAIKTIWRESALDYGALPTLTPVAGGPTLADCSKQFERCWLDHCPHWTSGYMHPADNMPSYYRDFTTWEGTAALRLCCDYSPAQKRDLLVRFVQVGIDWYGQYRVQTEPWGVNGHCNGRKFPILFAGKVLNDAAMLAVGTDHPLRFFGPDDARNVPVWWSEDGQTFYVEQTSPGVVNFGYGGYTLADVGLPEWGNFHAGGHGYDSASDSKAWDANSYRRCCSATSWVGTTLAMRAMGLQAAWNWPAHFDYMDRYLSTPPLPGEAWTRAWEPWQATMWDTHRSNL